MPHQDTDPLRRKWRWAKTQWEVTKEFGLMDESRKQPVLSPVGDGRRANQDARAGDFEEGNPK
ncbi:MAG: hypothetical protein ACM3ZC_05085 [Bacteroidota bacterium]